MFFLFLAGKVIYMIKVVDFSEVIKVVALLIYKLTMIIPIKKLRGLLDESIKGSMKLEVIAEDVYFQPWQSEFIVETAKKLSVEVISQSNETSSKPQITISEVKKDLPKPKPKRIVKTTQPMNILINGLSKRGITVENISKRKKEILPFLEKYAEKIGVDKKKLVSEVVYRLSNKK